MASPMARLQQEKQAAVTTGSAGSTGPPCAIVLRLISRSPRCAGLDSHRHSQIIICELDPSVGGQDHTTLPSASAALVSRSARVHRIPHPTSVTIAKRPS